MVYVLENQPEMIYRGMAGRAKFSMNLGLGGEKMIHGSRVAYAGEDHSAIVKNR